MKKLLLWLLVFIMWLVTLFFFIGSSATANAVDKVPDEFLSNTQLIEKYGGTQVEILKKVMECESGGNQNAWNKKDPNGGSRGIFQYQLQTWERYTKLYEEEMEINSSINQVKLTAFIFNKYPSERKAWACYFKVRGI